MANSLRPVSDTQFRLPAAEQPAAEPYDALGAIRRLGNAENPSDLERGLKEAIDHETDLTVKQMGIRDEARADVLTIISRARVRAGGDPAIWSPRDASAAFDVLSLVLGCQGQQAPAADPAFARLEEVEERAAAVRRLHAERALAKRAPTPAPEKAADQS